MKKNLCAFFVSVSSFIAFGQTVTPTVLASDGGYATSGQGSIAFTIGEPIVETYNGSTNITTMGFQQPDVDLVTLIQDQQQGSNVLVYPNPVKDEIGINFSGMKSGNYLLELYDALGKLIYKGQANISEASVRYTIKLNEIAAGAYFLNVSEGDFLKTVKINKVN